MDRLFQQHTVRRTVSLDSAWEYYFPRQGARIEPAEWSAGPRRVVEVPGVWEMLAERKNYRGQAVARKLVHVADDGWLRLVFKGVSHTARVFVDGREIGGHHNAYTPFTLEAGRIAAGEHELLVHISNEHGEISALHVPNDYYNYGGISRPATLQLIPGGATDQSRAGRNLTGPSSSSTPSSATLPRRPEAVELRPTTSDSQVVDQKSNSTQQEPLS